MKAGRGKGEGGRVGVAAVVGCLRRWRDELIFSLSRRERAGVRVRPCTTFHCGDFIACASPGWCQRRRINVNPGALRVGML